MATNPRKRQQKLERRSAKRKEKKHLVVREQSLGIAQRLAAAANCPPLDALVSGTLWSDGLGWVLFSRQLPDGSIAVAVFLVDRYCLGVKDAVGAVVSRFHYESDFLGKIRQHGKPQSVTPATLRKLVEAAVDYARSLGFPPHADYLKARHIFGDVNAADCPDEFEFGKDGKPFFIAGPYDSPRRCKEIMATLERTQGPGGSHFLMPIPPGTQLRAVDAEQGDEFDSAADPDVSVSQGT